MTQRRTVGAGRNDVDGEDHYRQTHELRVVRVLAGEAIYFVRAMVRGQLTLLSAGLFIFSLDSLRAVAITDVRMAVMNALLRAEAAWAHTSVDTVDVQSSIRKRTGA